MYAKRVRIEFSTVSLTKREPLRVPKHFDEMRGGSPYSEDEKVSLEPADLFRQELETEGVAELSEGERELYFDVYLKDYPDVLFGQYGFVIKEDDEGVFYYSPGLRREMYFKNGAISKCTVSFFHISVEINLVTTHCIHKETPTGGTVELDFFGAAVTGGTPEKRRVRMKYEFLEDIE